MSKPQWLFASAAVTLILAVALLPINDTWAYRLSMLTFGLVFVGWMIALREGEQD